MKQGASIHGSGFYQADVRKFYGDYNEVIIRANRICDHYGIDTRTLEGLMRWLVDCHEAGVLTDESTGIPISKVGSLEFIETLARKIATRDGFGDVLAQGPKQAARAIGAHAEKLVEDWFAVPEGAMRRRSLRQDPRLYTSTALIHATEPRATTSHTGEVAHALIHWIARAVKDTSLENLKAGEASPLAAAGALVIQDTTALREALESSYVSGDVVREIARRYWGSELAADFSTLDGKSLAAKKMQDRSYAKECLILCTLLWPMLHSPDLPGSVTDPTMESELLSAVTGVPVDRDGLDAVGEGVFNLSRAIAAREGRAGRTFDMLPDFCFIAPIVTDSYNRDCLVPGKNGEVISRKGAMLDRNAFEAMKDEYYRLREWDVETGLQTRKGLSSLSLGEIADDLAQRGLVR